MKTSADYKEIYSAFIKFQSEVQQPKKNAINPHFKSNYSTLDEIIKTVNPILNKNGLAVMQEITGDGEFILVTTRIIHESGQWLETEPLAIKCEKATPQGQGSATSYGRRYAISAILGISSEDDDDGNGAEPQQPSNPKQQGQSNKPVTNSDSSSLACTGCGAGITQAVKTYSEKNHGKALCKDCQRKEKK